MHITRHIQPPIGAIESFSLATEERVLASLDDDSPYWWHEGQLTAV